MINSGSLFSPFSVSLFFIIALFVYFRFHGGFNRPRWVILAVLFLMANAVFFLQHNHGSKTIGSWFENVNEYRAYYYVDVSSKNNQLIYHHIKAEISRPHENALAPELLVVI
jgi:hypothetical protein